MYRKKITIKGKEYIKLQCELGKNIFKKVISESGGYCDSLGKRYDIFANNDVTCLPDETILYTECKSHEEYITKENLYSITDTSNVGVDVLNLKQSQNNQDTQIEMSSEAIDFLLLNTTPPIIYGVKNNISEGGINMAGYIAMRVIQKGQKDIKAGQDYYRTYLSHPTYAQFKDDVDIILISEGYDYLIVPLV